MKTFLCDVSHWNGVIDWAIAHLHVGAVIMKATEAIAFVDNQFSNNKSGCLTHMIPWGAYHFFRPQYSPEAQAEHFVRTVGDNCKVYVVDVEAALLETRRELTDKTITRTIKNNSLRGRAKWGADEIAAGQNFIDANIMSYTIASGTRSVAYAPLLWELVERFLVHTDKLISADSTLVFYSSPGFWQAFMHKADGTFPNWNTLCDLWEAHYYVDEPMPMPPFAHCKMHQYTDNLTIPGIPGETDGNWFYGDPHEMAEYFANGDELPPPPPGDFRLRVITDELRIRSAPSLTAPVVGLLDAGEVLTVNVNGQLDWIRHERGWSCVQQGDIRHMEVE